MRNELALLEHIAELACTDVHAQLAELASRSEMPLYQKTNAQARLMRKAKAYSQKGRQTKLVGIREESGRAIYNDTEAVEALCEHWRPTFEEKEIKNKWLKFVEPFIQRDTGQADLGEPLAYDKFLENIDQLVDSGAGPDGIPYSGWSQGCDKVKHALYTYYVNFMRGGQLYDGANCSLMFFLAKGQEADDDHNATRLPKDTRPLCLSNTDSKIVALCINHKLSELAAKTVCGQQRGFMVGRNLPDNILEIETYGMINAAIERDSPGIMLFDFRAAQVFVLHFAENGGLYECA